MKKYVYKGNSIIIITINARYFKFVSKQVLIVGLNKYYAALDLTST